MARARRTAQQSRPIARARLYARVSSKDQEKEGFSIPAQLKLLREYAAEEGLTVAEEYVDVETAKRTGRVSFGEMVHDLRTSPGARIVLVEKTDRLYRNLKDWVTLDELDVEVRGGPRNSDRLLRWDPDQGEGVWNATEETELSG